MRTIDIKGHNSHIRAANTGMLALFTDHTPVYAPRKRKPKVVEPGTVYSLRRIESDGKGTLKLWGIDNKDSDWRKVSSGSVTIYMGRVPDWRMELSLVEHGYQADTHAGCQPLAVHCRDFGGNHPIVKLIERLESKSEGWLADFRKGL